MDKITFMPTEHDHAQPRVDTKQQEEIHSKFRHQFLGSSSLTYQFNRDRHCNKMSPWLKSKP